MIIKQEKLHSLWHSMKLRIDGVLYHIEPGKILQIVLPEKRFSMRLIVVYLVPTYGKQRYTDS